MFQLDGDDVARWASRASQDDLVLLANAEYSDVDDIFVVQGVGPTGLAIAKDGQSQPVLRPYSFFSSGTFFLNDEPGTLIAELIKGSMSPIEKRIGGANEYLLKRGFAVSELGGDTVALFLSDAIRNFEDFGLPPNDEQWSRASDILTNGSASVMKCGTKYVAKWVEHSETQNGGRFDFYRRVLLSVLYRYTGQPDKALQVTAVVDSPQHIYAAGGKSSMSVLCTTRAATMMDLAELQPANRTDLLTKARQTLNKANALSGSDSDEIREAYSRLKRLELQG
ncbi:MAG: hypothetical protein ABIK82_12435 [Pseudomonadota bacterium]